jgi:L-asparaginase
MKRIQVIYTGGTLGMLPTDQGLAPSRGFERILREKMAESVSASLHSNITWRLQEWDELIDSAYATPAHWHQLAKSVRDLRDEADGFVILHGTDTLAWTGSALSFWLRDIDCPIVLTGAQYPISDACTDALDNFVLALQAASDVRLSHCVCIAFGDQLLQANRSSKFSSSAYKAFCSPNHSLLGRRSDTSGLLVVELCPTVKSFDYSNLSILPIKSPAKIEVLHMHPGLDSSAARRWLLYSHLDALVIRSYGSGNIKQVDAGLIRLINELSAQGTLVVNVTQCPHGHVKQGTYASSDAIVNAGVLSASDMTLECALAKLDWLFALDVEHRIRKQLFGTSLCGEITGQVQTV